MELFIESIRNVISGLHKTLRKSFSENSNFSLTELETISLIYRNKKILPSELAAKTKITTPSMSQILKKMEIKKIICRTPSEEDKRKVFVSLTKEGVQIVKKARSSQDNLLEHLIESRLTEEEIIMLKKAVPALKKLNSTNN